MSQEPIAGPVGPLSEDPSAEAALPPEEEGSPVGFVKIGAVFLVLVGVVVFLLFGTSEGSPLMYSKPLNEVMAAPTEFLGRDLRVEGDLRQGSVLFREEPCEWRFTLEKEGHEMAVRFPRCVVPDTFRDDYGISVTVMGQLGEDGVFLANDVVPRCPSKYEERLESGAEMPEHRPAGGPIQPAPGS